MCRAGLQIWRHGYNYDVMHRLFLIWKMLIFLERVQHNLDHFQNKNISSTFVDIRYHQLYLRKIYLRHAGQDFIYVVRSTAMTWCILFQIFDVEYPRHLMRTIQMTFQIENISPTFIDIVNNIREKFYVDMPCRISVMSSWVQLRCHASFVKSWKSRLCGPSWTELTSIFPKKVCLQLL